MSQEFDAHEATGLHGIVVPVLTPLDDRLGVDATSLRRLIDHLLEAGVHGIWSMGTTGEFAMLPAAERARAIATTVEHVDGRVPVVANVAAASTPLALAHARDAVEAGARVLTATAPYYYPHSGDEIAAHFRALKDAHPDLPLLVYDIPSTVKVGVPLDVTLSLAADGVVAGIKDSRNDFEWFRALVEAVRAAGLDASFAAFIGSRNLIDAGIAIGARGAVPANANVAARECVAVYEAVVRGDWAAARAAQAGATAYLKTSRVARGGSGNAATISSMKEILRLRGVIESATVVPPLRPLAEGERTALAEALAALDREAQALGV
jgi:4-hydroxy-tetrahydrodipicolinate synthase